MPIKLLFALAYSWLLKYLKMRERSEIFLMRYIQLLNYILFLAHNKVNKQRITQTWKIYLIKIIILSLKTNKYCLTSSHPTSQPCIINQKNKYSKLNSSYFEYQSSISPSHNKNLVILSNCWVYVTNQDLVPRNIIQIAINAYNDLQFCENVVQWLPGLIYFAVQVSTVQAQILQEQSLKTNTHKIKEQQINLEKPHNKAQQNQIHSNKSLNSDQKIPQNITKITPEELEQIQNKKKSNDPCLKIEWQKLFLVPLKKLQVYSEKIISYYQKLSVEEYEDQEQGIKQTITSNK